MKSEMPNGTRAALPGLMDDLKSGTASWHERLEREGAASRLMSPALDLPLYREILRLFYGWYVPIEQGLEKAHPELLNRLDWTRRQKRGRLYSDLLSTGMPEESLAALKKSPALETPDEAQAWGVLYVMEGATLGGRMISGHLQRTLGLGPGNGALFFSGYGEATGESWREFCVLMQGSNKEDMLRRSVVDGAVQAFASFHRWLVHEEMPVA